MLLCGLSNRQETEERGDFVENTWAQNACLIDGLTLSEFSGSEKNRSGFSGGFRKSLRSLWIESEGFPKRGWPVHLAALGSAENEKCFSFGSLPLSVGPETSLRCSSFYDPVIE